jgi:cobalt/nickel transport system permease protein
MHIPDGYLGPQTYLATYAAVIPFWVWAGNKLKKTLTGARAPLLGLAAAFSFVVMMLNVPIPGGTTGHAVGAALIAILLGPAEAMIAVTVALAVQALVFGDGGITAFGANCLNMAVIMPLVASGAFKLFAGKAQPGSRRRFFAAAAAGYLSLNIAAITTAVMFGIQPGLAQDAAGHPLYAPYSLNIALPAMMLEHLLLFGFVEAAVTALALRFLEAGAPVWQPDFQTTVGARNPLARWLMIVAILVVLSPLGILVPAWLGAGSAWGEWSAEEVSQLTGHLPAGMAALADKWRAPLPDYAFPPGVSKAEPWQGEAAGWLALTYVFSALLGIGLIILISWALGKLIGRRAPIQKTDTLDSKRWKRRLVASTSRPLAKNQEAFLHFSQQTLFAEHWARAPRFLQGLEIRTKLIVLLAALVTVSLIHDPWGLAAMTAAPLILAGASRLGFKGLHHPIWWAGPALAFLLALPVVFSWLTPGEAVWVIFRRHYFALTEPGLIVGGRLVLRVSASVWWVGALLLSSRWDNILTGLRGLRVPAIFVFTLAMAYRYLFLLARITEKSFLARRSRTLLPVTAGTERALLGVKVAFLFRRSQRLSEQVYAAMVARGFHGEFPTLEGRRLRTKDIFFAAALLGFCAGLLLIDRGAIS